MIVNYTITNAAWPRVIGTWEKGIVKTQAKPVGTTQGNAIETRCDFINSMEARCDFINSMVYKWTAPTFCDILLPMLEIGCCGACLLC